MQQDEKKRATAANKVLPKAGLTCHYDSFVLNQTLVLQMTFVLNIPAFGNTQTVVRNPC